jgi:hypothetical protein
MADPLILIPISVLIIIVITPKSLAFIIERRMRNTDIVVQGEIVDENI